MKFCGAATTLLFGKSFTIKLTFGQVNFVWAHTFKTVALFCIFTQQCSTMVVKIQCHWNPDLIKELKWTWLENERDKWRLLHLRKRNFSWTVLSFSRSSVSSLNGARSSAFYKRHGVYSNSVRSLSLIHISETTRPY